MPDSAAIARALDGPAGAFIEDGCAPVERPLGLVLRLRTGAAFHLPVAAIFTKALKHRLDLSSAIAESVELALHEAVANAIIHGNLGISSQDRGTPGTYGDFCRILDASLHDDAATARVINIAAYWTKTLLSVAVTDEGNGFTGPLQAVSDHTAHGRGLSIVRALAVAVRWNQRRRRLTFVFNLACGAT